MNSSSPQQNETALHAVDYWQVIKNRYGIILLTLLLVFMTAAVITYVMPRKFESEAQIEVMPRTPGTLPLGQGLGGEAYAAGRMTQNFFGTEFEKIKSSNSLAKVVDKLDLVNKWGVDRETAIQMLKGMVNTQNIRSTDLISIRVRHTNKDDARDITAEVATAYKDYRAEIEGQDSKKALDELNKAVRDQEDKVEERRKTLIAIVRSRKIIYRGNDSFYQSGVDEEKPARDAMDTYIDLQNQKLQLESQITCLLKYTSDQLMVYASGLDLPENIIKNLYPQYLEATRQLNNLKIGGLGDRHPTVRSAVQEIEAMKRQLDEGVVNLRATLQAQLELATDRLQKTEGRKDDTREEAIKRGLDAQDYVEAKRNFETDQDLLQTMKLKQVGERITSTMPPDTIRIHEFPQLAQTPVSPNVTLNLVLGAVGGLIF